MAILKTVMAVAVMTATIEWKMAGVHMHHVVGGYQGWDPSSDVASWSYCRRFSVGDKICKLLLFTFFLISFAQKSVPAPFTL
ncbi:Fumarylacetoacetase [Hibiscus syriacus]|uniref:Fumarylacetoacetase n=1 Tax=Hibiscus syriacus TaxID=106335 RepID=A0A6A3A068_HIBSY|nr:Fumarylacetoacetase [Hibiscus syriacus]